MYHLHHIYGNLLGNEEDDHFHLITFSSIVKGRITLVVKEVLAAVAIRKECLCHNNVSLLSRNVDWHDINVITRTGIRFMGEKELHHLELSTFNSTMQWSIEFGVMDSDQSFGLVGVATQDFFHKLDKSPLASCVEWSVTIFISGLYLCTMTQQLLHNSQVPTDAGLMKGAVIIAILHINNSVIPLYTCIGYRNERANGNV